MHIYDIWWDPESSLTGILNGILMWLTAVVLNRPISDEKKYVYALSFYNCDKLLVIFPSEDYFYSLMSSTF